MSDPLDLIIQDIENIPDCHINGLVTGINGFFIEGSGIENFISIGTHCKIFSRYGEEFLSEVIRIHKNKFILLSFNVTSSITVGCKIAIIQDSHFVCPDKSWLGRVINGLAHPIDQKGGLIKGSSSIKIISEPQPIHSRSTLKEKLDLGVKSINTFVTCCKGQRMGIFAGSGVGKSVLISMLAKFASCDVKVVGLVGERAREVNEFIHVYLGEEGLKNTIIIASTGDESPIMRKRASYLTVAIAEYFRDIGKDVLCLMDSVTRFAMSQREIGLYSGEPPTTKGYTPSVFSELPKLLERAGSVGTKGSITGLFTVLVEGDDMNDPIADAVRSILDGHMVLDRKIAESGRYPAINVQKSVSRTMPMCNTKKEIALVKKARRLISIYTEMEELILLGAYKVGSDKNVDDAIKYHDKIEKFLEQDMGDKVNIEKGYDILEKLLVNV